MRTFGLFIVGFIIGTAATNCGKKPETVNPQITDAVTQGTLADAGTVPVTGVAVLEEAKALKQEVREVLQSVSDGGISTSDDLKNRFSEENKKLQEELSKAK